MHSLLPKRLSNRSLLISLFALFFVPFGIVEHRLIQNLTADLALTNRERLGLAYHRSLRYLLELVLQHRGGQTGCPPPPPSGIYTLLK